jgi:hypothetical protein
MLGLAAFPSAPDPPRAISNPNVLLEVGFAAAAIGWSRIVMLHNLETGSVEELPFDIRHRSILAFRDGSAESRRQLGGQLKAAFGPIIEDRRRVRGLTWINNEHRRYLLGRAFSEQETLRDLLDEWRQCVGSFGEQNTLHAELLPVGDLQAALPVATTELDVADASYLTVFVRFAGMFNHLTSRLPVGTASGLEPTLKAVADTFETIEKFHPSVVRILDHAWSLPRPEPGERLPKAPGKLPFMDDIERPRSP